MDINTVSASTYNRPVTASQGGQSRGDDRADLYGVSQRTGRSEADIANQQAQARQATASSNAEKQSALTAWMRAMGSARAPTEQEQTPIINTEARAQQIRSRVDSAYSSNNGRENRTENSHGSRRAATYSSESSPPEADDAQARIDYLV